MKGNYAKTGKQLKTAVAKITNCANDGRLVGEGGGFFYNPSLLGPLNNTERYRNS